MVGRSSVASPVHMMTRSIEWVADQWPRFFNDGVPGRLSCLSASTLILSSLRHAPETSFSLTRSRCATCPLVDAPRRMAEEFHNPLPALVKSWRLDFKRY